MSLFYQTMLRSNSALALYENCKRYATNPSKLTNRNSWEWWFSVITGLPVGSPLPEYKYFKRDTIKPSIAEINAVTDIDVELIEHKIGRKVAELQFAVHLKDQRALDLPMPPIVDSELIARIAKLGFSAKDAADISVSVDEDFLRATLRLVEERMRKKDIPELDSPAAYFRSALRNKWANAPAIAAETTARLDAKKKAAKKPKDGMTLRDKFEAKRREEATTYFNEIGSKERDALMLKFSEVASPAVLPHLKKQGLKSPLARTAFYKWLSVHLWGEPTNDELIAFADEALSSEK